MQIISITGTKGKTSINRLISFILYSFGNNVLRVDSDGHFINESKKSSYSDSIKLFGDYAPTVCPGKYLIAMKSFYPNFTAVLESSIGCAKEGLGYRTHQIGIFSNIYNDHITGQKNRRTREDLAKEKNFIFKKTSPLGFIIFNADDSHVCAELKKFYSTSKKQTLIPIGLNFKFFNIKDHLSTGGKCLTIKDKAIVLQSKRACKKIIGLKKIGWLLDDSFVPFLYNILLVFGCLYAYFNKTIPVKTIESLCNYRIDKTGGRMVTLKNANGVRILFDYAHEKYSLKHLANLGRKLTQKRLLGVLRISPNNRDSEIKKISRAIGPFFDEIFIYDKLDGKHRGKYIEPDSNFIRKVGETSRIFSKNMTQLNKGLKVTRNIAEEKAIEKAAMSAKKDDLVIVIWGDNKNRSLNYIKKYFKASFI